MSVAILIVLFDVKTRRSVLREKLKQERFAKLQATNLLKKTLDDYSEEMTPIERATYEIRLLSVRELFNNRSALSVTKK